MALNNNLITVSVRYIRVHQYRGSKWMMQYHPMYCHTKRTVFHFLPVSFTLPTCVPYSKKAFFAPEVYISTVDISRSCRNFLPDALMQWKCVNGADNLCYIYGDVMFPLQKREINPVTRKAYHIYFGCQIWDLKKSSASHIGCNTCAANLRSLLRRKRQLMVLPTPSVQRHQTNHISDCCFCTVPPLQQVTSKVQMLISSYQNIPSVLRPVLHVKDLPFRNLQT